MGHTSKMHKVRELLAHLKEITEKLGNASDEMLAKYNELKTEIESLGYSVAVVVVKDQQGNIQKLQLAAYSDGSTQTRH
jgi:hypothetical protein